MDVNRASQTNSTNAVNQRGSRSSNQLQGATAIHNVPAGQQHLKKATNLNKVNTLLKPALSNFMAARQVSAEKANALTNQCMKVVNSKNPSDTERVKLENTRAIAEEMMAVRANAIAAYDDAISRIKNISITVTLRGNAVKGGVDGMLANLGLSEPKTMDLIGKLREIRAEAYDDFQYAQAWHAYVDAVLDQRDANTAADRVQLVQWAQDADPATLTEDEKKVQENVLAEAESTLREQLPIYQEKNNGAISKHDLCVDLLANLPIDGVTLPDSESAKNMLAQSLDSVLELRSNVFNDMEATFEACKTKLNQAFANALTQSSTQEMGEDEVSSQEMEEEEVASLGTGVDEASSLAQLAELGMEAKQVGTEALAYAGRNIDLYDQALSGIIDLTSENIDDLLAEKKQLQADKTKLSMGVFDMQRMELLLLVQVLDTEYDPGLMERYEQAQNALSQTKTLHQYCTNTMIDGDGERVPEHLLHEVLKNLPADYEDAVCQIEHLADQFDKKGKGVPNNDRVVELMTLLADSSKAMAKLAESQLGQLVSADNAEQGSATEAKTWVDDTLKLKFPHLYQTDEPVDELTDELAELEVVETAAVVQNASTAVRKQAKVVEFKAATSSQKGPGKELKNAIASAENALNSEEIRQDMVRLAKESDKYRHYAEHREKEGASPCTVEDTMKLAARAELALADRYTTIAKRFQRALNKMATSHPKREDFTKQISTLTVEADKHKAKHEQFLRDGETMRIRMSKNLPPTHSLFNYLYDKGQVQSVKRHKRVELNSLDKNGKARINPRTNEEIKDYIDEYGINLTGGKKIAAHFHYKSMDADDTDIVACHFKLWAQRKQGLQYVMKQAKEGKDIELHRAKTNRETLVKLQQKTGNQTS